MTDASRERTVDRPLSDAWAEWPTKPAWSRKKQRADHGASRVGRLSRPTSASASVSKRREGGGLATVRRCESNVVGRETGSRRRGTARLMQAEEWIWDVMDAHQTRPGNEMNWRAKRAWTEHPPRINGHDVPLVQEDPCSPSCARPEACRDHGHIGRKKPWVQ